MNNPKVINELKRLAAKNRGLFLPEAVVEAAKPETSPLHSQFTWDNTEAAKKYRIWEARRLQRLRGNDWRRG